MSRPMIDIFCHILPEKYKKALYNKNLNTVKLQEMEGTNKTYPALSDLQLRLKLLSRFEGMRQVLTILHPPEDIVNPAGAMELAKIANEEMAELVAKYPDHFIAGVACLPTKNIDVALREAERAIKELNLKGAEIYTPCNGRPVDSPELFPLYEMMTKFDLPLWLHPYRPANIPDYEGEKESRYNVFLSIGWPYETSVAMVRFVRSGVLEKYPSLKIITHHLGGMTPYYISRLRWREHLRGSSSPAIELSRPPEEYFKMFYADTVVGNNVPALMCGHSFFGAEHVLFASDIPSINDYEDKIAPLEKMPISESEKNMIFEGNARRLLHI